MSAPHTRAKDESEFPDPHRFGIWWDRVTFQVYRNLSLVKAAVTNVTNYEGNVNRDVRIYEHTGEAWELIYEISRGSRKLDHELWAKGPAPKTMAVSDGAVQAAIQSIMGTSN